MSADVAHLHGVRGHDQEGEGEGSRLQQRKKGGKERKDFSYHSKGNIGTEWGKVEGGVGRISQVEHSSVGARGKRPGGGGE